jgi:hypothetical protein
MATLMIDKTLMTTNEIRDMKRRLDAGEKVESLKYIEDGIGVRVGEESACFAKWSGGYEVKVKRILNYRGEEHYEKNLFVGERITEVLFEADKWLDEGLKF